MSDIDRYRHNPLVSPARRSGNDIDAATSGAVGRIRAQANKEIAAMNTIAGCADAVDRLPADLPPRHRRMAERIAVATSRFVVRLAR